MGSTPEDHLRAKEFYREIDRMQLFARIFVAVLSAGVFAFALWSLVSLWHALAPVR